MSEHQGLRAASYLILKKGEQVLLLKRRNTGFRDGYWGLIAGHVDKGETFREAMVREAEEEAKIEIHKEDIEPFAVFHRDSEESVYVDLFFACEQWNGEIENGEPGKCEELAWFHREDLPRKTIDFVRKALHDTSPNLEYLEHGWKD